jgi:hypothetical protein
MFGDFWGTLSGIYETNQIYGRVGRKKNEKINHMRRGLTPYIPIFAMEKMDFVSEFDHVHLSKHVLGANLSQNEVGAVFLHSDANLLCFGIFLLVPRSEDRKRADLCGSEFSAGRKLADLCGSELSAAQIGNLLTFVDPSPVQRGNLLTFVEPRKLAVLCGSELSAAQIGKLLTFVDPNPAQRVKLLAFVDR